MLLVKGRKRLNGSLVQETKAGTPSQQSKIKAHRDFYFGGYTTEVYHIIYSARPRGWGVDRGPPPQHWNSKLLEEIAQE